MALSARRVAVLVLACLTSPITMLSVIRFVATDAGDGYRVNDTAIVSATSSAGAPPEDVYHDRDALLDFPFFFAVCQASVESVVSIIYLLVVSFRSSDSSLNGLDGGGGHRTNNSFFRVGDYLVFLAPHLVYSVLVMVAAMHLPVWEMLAMYHIDIPLQALLSFMWFRRRPVTSQVLLSLFIIATIVAAIFFRLDTGTGAVSVAVPSARRTLWFAVFVGARIAYLLRGNVSKYLLLRRVRIARSQQVREISYLPTSPDDHSDGSFDDSDPGLISRSSDDGAAAAILRADKSVSSDEMDGGSLSSSDSDSDPHLFFDFDAATLADLDTRFGSVLYDEYFFSIDLPKTLLLEWSASLGIVPVTLLLSFFARESPFAYETVFSSAVSPAVIFSLGALALAKLLFTLSHSFLVVSGTSLEITLVKVVGVMLAAFVASALVPLESIGIVAFVALVMLGACVAFYRWIVLRAREAEEARVDVRLLRKRLPGLSEVDADVLYRVDANLGHETFKRLVLETAGNDPNAGLIGVGGGGVGGGIGVGGGGGNDPTRIGGLLSRDFGGIVVTKKHFDLGDEDEHLLTRDWKLERDASVEGSADDLGSSSGMSLVEGQLPFGYGGDRGGTGYGEFGQYEKRMETTSSSESYSSDDGITIQKLRDELHQPKRRIVGAGASVPANRVSGSYRGSSMGGTNRISTDRPTGFIGASNVPDTISEQSFVDVGSGSITSSVGSDGDLFVDGDGEPDDGRGSFALDRLGRDGSGPIGGLGLLADSAPSSNLARGSLRGPALAGGGVGSGLGGVGGGGETGRLSDVPAGEEYEYQYSEYSYVDDEGGGFAEIP